MKKTLIVMPELFWGGAEKQFRFLISKLKENIVACVIHSYSHAIDYNCVEKKYIFENSKTTFYQIQVSKKSSKINRFIHSCCTIAKIINKHHISSVIVYDSFGINLIPYFKLFRLFVVYSERNSGEGLINNKRYMTFVKMADCISANSAHAKEVIQAKVKHRVYFIKNGIIDQHNFKPHLDGVHRFLIPARISRVKNQLLVLKMLSEDESTNNRVKFAGVSEDQSYFKELKKYVNDNHLTKKVEFLGYCEDPEILYQDIDAVILPSFEEGTSNVILECFLRGIPVFVSSIEMNVFTENLRRFSFSPYDEKQLSASIKLWNQLSSESKSKILSENYKYVISEHSVSKMVNSYVNLLRTGVK